MFFSNSVTLGEALYLENTQSVYYVGPRGAASVALFFFSFSFFYTPRSFVAGTESTKLRELIVSQRQAEPLISDKVPDF